ncbi:MAG: helix-turn-helix transcriptional regulator [Blautia sp.]|nr:helix-turn-helix transcriptional regulator [Blautia sp.]
MKNRIRTIRKNAGMTQQQFAERLGISRNTVATYETSSRIPIDAVIVSICREFGVREEWLRTGQGDIYKELTPDLELSKWFGQILMEEESSFKRRFLLALTTLKEGEWTALERLSEVLFGKADRA